MVGAMILAYPSVVGAAEDWVITNFDSQITVTAAGPVQIIETINVDFGSLQKHGIFRDVPYAYRNADGTLTYTDIKLEEVKLDNQPVPVRTQKNDGNVRFIIGDAKKIVSGVHSYRISYVVTGILRGFETYDELYWNVTGLQWPVPIQKATVTVTLPAPAVIQQACYIGLYSGTETCDIGVEDNTKVQFLSPRPLVTGEGLTVAVGYTKSLVPLLTIQAPVQKTFSVINFSIGFITVFVVGLCLFFAMWWRQGRDARVLRGQALPWFTRETVVAEYDPPAGLRPAEIGTLIDERADTLDVTATIVDLAVRGYITITEKAKTWIFGKTDYELTKTEKGQEGLLPYEEKLLDSLFQNSSSVLTSSLEKSFYTHLTTVKTMIYEEVTKKELFAEDPQKARKQYSTYGAILVAVGVVLVWGGPFLALFLQWSSKTEFFLGAPAALIPLGVIAMGGSFLMPRRTAHGRELLRQVRGYKLFVSGTEKNRQPFFEKQNIFMEVLPYAMVFGVTKQLARAMADMGIKPMAPAWYIASGPFNPVMFSDHITTFSHALGTAIASTPSSSGSGSSGSSGGSSGGGFGGGGGGSW